MPQALVPLLIAGGTAAAGAIGGSRGARTAQTSGTQQSSGSNTFSQGPTFRPEQQNLQSDLYKRLSDRLSGPAPDLNPLRVSGIDQINKTYAGLTDRLMQQLSARGFGNSGKVGLNLQQLEAGRTGDIGNLESQLQRLALQQGNLNLDQALRYAFASPGFSGNSSFSNTGQSARNQIYPGSAFGGGASAGLSGAIAGGLFDMLQHFLLGGG